MIKRKLQWKLVLFICLIAVCLIIPIGLLLNINIESYFYNEFVEKIERGFELYNIEDKDVSTIYEEIKELYGSSFGLSGDNKSYTVINKRTNEVYSSDPIYLNKDKVTFLTEMYSSDKFLLASNGVVNNYKELITLNGRTFYEYLNIDDDTIIYFRYYKEDWQEMVADFNSTIVTTLILSLLIAFVMGLGLSRAITNPIENITRKTKNIAEGDFGQILTKAGNDEIGLLSNSINDMSISLKNMLAEISTEKSKVDDILNNMTSGILAFDKSLKLTHANPIALKMFNREKIVQDLPRILHEYNIDVKEDDIINNNEAIFQKKIVIDVQGKLLGVSFALLKGNEDSFEGAMIILRDITEEKKLDKMREEFVANVSHELKTPLTSIKSYSETLLDGAVDDEKMRIRFLEVINSETDRMSRIVKDLLQLSSIDMNRFYLNRAQHSVDELIIKTISKIQVVADEKKHTIDVDIQYGGNAFYDYDRVQQVLINLLTNAIKYTDDGGKILVKSLRNSEYAYISVKDNGIGIPKKDLPRIFERFYTVDKARSRKLGGTGLGLAIAKEIMLEHKGNIIIESKKSVGTTITMIIPINEENDEEKQ